MAITQDQQFTNNATTTVPSTISNVATSITVSTGTGALFPTLAGAQFAVCTIINTISSDPGYGQLEIVKVTARSGDVFTIVRGQESTSAKSFPAGCVFELRPTAGGINEVYNKMIAGDALQAPLASPTFTGDPKAPTPALGDNDTSIATTGYVQTAFNTYGDRHVNMIINPYGAIQQETVTPITTDVAYFADQWVAGFVAPTAAFQMGVTGGTVSAFDPNYMFVKTTTAKGALAAGDLLLMQQRIEGFYSRRLLYGTANARGSWIRWRASASQSGTASIAIRNAATNRSFVQSFAVTTTPTDYSLFVPGDTTGTWVSDFNLSVVVSFCHAAGTTFQTSTLGAWQAGNFFAANTQSNMLDTVNRQLNITDVQWNDAPILLPFQTIDYQQELARCQRYFWKQLAIQTNDNVGANAFAFSTSDIHMSLRHPVPMRTTPTAVVSLLGASSPAGAAITANTATNSGTNAYVLGLNLAMASASWTAGQGSDVILLTSGSSFIGATARM